MQCPICDVTLMPNERQGVEIDYCPKCRGVWLDRGELDKILERSSAAFAPGYPSRDEYGREHDDHDDHDDDYRAGDPRRRRRGGFLGDLFDIG